MVKILYGVAGEGMGHAIRSAVIIEHLLRKHDVVIVSSGPAYSYLAKRFKNVHKVLGLRIAVKRNKVRNIRTAISNIWGILRNALDSIRTVRRLIRKHRIDMIITDFEPFTTICCGKLPVISLDNNHIIQNCKIDVPKIYFQHYLTAKFVIRLLVWWADHFLITTFFYPAIKVKNTILMPSVLRETILDAKVSTKDFILVYQSSEGNKRLMRHLKRTNNDFIIYGLGRRKREDNLTFKSFNEQGFVNDLANCNALITNGGFSSITEAIHLGKPVLAIPIRKHFEQLINAIYLKKLGYGTFITKSNRKAIQKFFENLPSYRKKLGNYKRFDNSRLFKKLDELIKCQNL